MLQRWYRIGIVGFIMLNVFAAMAEKAPRTIVFYGNSLSAGYGLDPANAFPALIQARVDSLKWNFKVVNAGLSGETTSGGLRRINWILKQKTDVFVLELGANDALRGTELGLTRQNLQAIVDSVMYKHPQTKIVMAGMLAPPNMGREYTQQFKTIYPELAAKNKIALIPFLLEGVAGDPKLNQADRIHPNEVGHRIVADNVWKVLKPILEAIQK